MDESFPKTLIEFGYAFNDCQYFLLQSFDYWLHFLIYLLSDYTFLFAHQWDNYEKLIQMQKLQETFLLSLK